MNRLQRRGFDLGSAPLSLSIDHTTPSQNHWLDGFAIHIPKLCADAIDEFDDAIKDTEVLVLAVLEGESCDDLLGQPPYADRLSPQFEQLGCAINEGDEQEIETVMFDAVQGSNILAEDLWIKVSWLSFYEDDASLRFRFSFGVDLEEDVAADQTRQHFASLLTEAVFPESAIVTRNAALLSVLNTILPGETCRFVERIVYINAPNGGAYLHHDLERGHAGVVYAQITGKTFWLALPRHQLVSEIQAFVNAGHFPATVNTRMQQELTRLVKDSALLAQELASFSNSTIIHLINETEEFVQHLIRQGYGKLVETGDVILLPQQDDDNACWHSVFCLGDEAGQALSFAIRND